MNITGYLLGDGFATVAVDALKMIAVLLAPFVVFALTIHWFESITQRRLAERFGWNAVLWTGWLGTPIHELSHVAACYLFRHRVDEISLFEPDRESGRLGFVRHSYRRESWFEEIGNLFIGVAPLLGGSIVLAILLWMFYPQAAEAGIDAAKTASDGGGMIEQTWRVAVSIAGQILLVSNMGTVRFWVFLYLVLCVGSHMAPSASDYRGATRGVVLASVLLVSVVLLLAFSGVNLASLADGLVAAAGPLFAVLGLTVLLVGLATAIVYLLTSFLPRKYLVR